MGDLLQGSLSFLSLEEVLSILSGRRASGRLWVKGVFAEVNLNLVDGKLAGTDKQSALEALLWESGSFGFLDEKKPAAGAETIAVGPIIEEAKSQREEWKRLRAAFPDDYAVLLEIDDPQAQEKVTLSREHWKVLSRVNGERTVGELLAEGDPFQRLHILSELLKNKLIEFSKLDEKAKRAQAEKKAKAAEAEKNVKVSKEQASPAEPGEKSKPGSTKPFAVPPEVLAGDAKAASQAPEKTVMGMKLPQTERPPAAPQAKGEPIIACLTLDGPGDQMFPLVEDEYKIGREAPNPIRLQDASVSANHARVFRSPEGFVVEDLGSRNGTYVNGERVQKRVLRENDRVRLGKVQLIYNIAGDKPAVGPSTLFQPRPS